jgi:hypothetical protein
VISVVCPTCGGTEAMALGPGRYRCNSRVTFYEDVLVDDPGALLAYGTPGPKWETIRRERLCGHEFVLETERSGDLCSGTQDGSSTENDRPSLENGVGEAVVQLRTSRTESSTAGAVRLL